MPGSFYVVSTSTIRGPGNELDKCVLRETDPYDHI